MCLLIRAEIDFFSPRHADHSVPFMFQRLSSDLGITLLYVAYLSLLR